MTLTIRQETPSDYAAIRQVVETAFMNAEHTDHDEQNLVERLRLTDNYIPELALEAEQGGHIVGHILFTTVRVGENTALCLAPVAVAPAFQGKGVGDALIRTGHAIAAEMGYTHCILVGHEHYYPRFGYVPAKPVGLKCPFPVPDANFMVHFLNGTPQRLEGTVVFSPAFGITA